MEEKRSAKKVWLTVVAAVSVIAIIVSLVVIAALNLRTREVPSDDVCLVADQSSYMRYETRNDEVYLFYNLTLRNDTDTDLSNFKIKGTFKSDALSGYILDSEAFARLDMTGEQTFSLAAGETKELSLIFMASYYQNDGKPSGELPALTLVTVDGEIDVKTSGKHSS